MTEHVFIAGTDTDVGKTVVSCSLLRQLNQGSRLAVGMKPVAAGAQTTPVGLRNDDAVALAASSPVSLPYETTNPFAFPDPVSPDIAARRCGGQVELDPIVVAFNLCRSLADVVLVEGIGGWRVPLSDHLQTHDLVCALNLPVILVCGIRLGCINHCLLSAETIINDGRQLLGWVANAIDPGYDNYRAETVASLLARMPAPLLAEIAWQAAPDPAIIDHELKPCVERLWPPTTAVESSD